MIRSLPSLSNFVTPETRAPTTPAAGADGRADFASELKRFVADVETEGRAAETKSLELASGGGNLHETALALEKADVSMRLLLKTRNKVVEAYQEFSRMPV